MASKCGLCSIPRCNTRKSRGRTEYDARCSKAADKPPRRRSQSGGSCTSNTSSDAGLRRAARARARIQRRELSSHPTPQGIPRRVCSMKSSWIPTVSDGLLNSRHLVCVAVASTEACPTGLTIPTRVALPEFACSRQARTQLILPKATRQATPRPLPTVLSNQMTCRDKQCDLMLGVMSPGTFHKKSQCTTQHLCGV